MTPCEAVSDALDYIETNPDDHASRLLAALISEYDHALSFAERAARLLPMELPVAEADESDEALSQLAADLDARSDHPAYNGGTDGLRPDSGDRGGVLPGDARHRPVGAAPEAGDAGRARARQSGTASPVEDRQRSRLTSVDHSLGGMTHPAGDFTERVYVLFKDGRSRIDILHGRTQVEARLDAYSHAKSIADRVDVKAAYRLDYDEPDPEVKRHDRT